MSAARRCPSVLEAAVPAEPRRKAWPELERALELLLSGRSARVRLELDGPAPESEEAWLAPIEQAAHRACRLGKEFDCALRGFARISAGAAERLSSAGARLVLEARLGEARSGRARRRLARLEGLGMPALVEVALAPEDLANLGSGLAGLESLAPARIRFKALCGKTWGAQAPAALEAGLSSWLGGLMRGGGAGAQGLDVLNFCEEEEPELLASNLRLTDDAELGWAGVWRHARAWPELRRAEPSVSMAGLKDLDALFLSPAQRQDRAARFLRGASRELWLDNARLALRLREFFARPFPGLRAPSENKELRRGLIGAALAEQDRYLRRLAGVESVFLFLRSGCVNDCVFCKRKPQDAGQAMEEVESFLKGNLRVGRRKIALVGNEPLLHPRIADVIRSCRRHGFERIEVMTSGTLLADLSRARELSRAGATAFSIPLYSSRPAEHDALTRRAGSFRAAVRGIENASRLGAEVFLHSSLMRQNLRSLERLEGWVARRWGASLSVLCLRPKEPEGMNLPYRELAPSYREIISSGLKVRWLVGFPACIQRRLPARGGGGSARMGDSVKLYLLHQDFVKLACCAGCPQSHRCVGTFREHVELYAGDLPLMTP